MAREEQDREDLLAEATALVERAEIEIDGRSIIVGFRRDGSASVYFGTDPVYQFNTAGELRRAFVDGLMIKAVGGQLASLTRQRTTDKVQLVRHNLNAAETQELLATMQSQIANLRKQLQEGNYRLRGQVPPEKDIVSRTMAWLDGFTTKIGIAKTPRVG